MGGGWAYYPTSHYMRMTEREMYGASLIYIAMVVCEIYALNQLENGAKPTSQILF